MLRSSLHLFIPHNDKSGRSHWITQRFSAIILLPLYAWLLLVALPMASTAGYEELLLWMGKPMNSILIVLMIFFSMRHMAFGLEVIIDDYIADPLYNRVALLAMRWSTLLLAVSVLGASVKIFMNY